MTVIHAWVHNNAIHDQKPYPIWVPEFYPVYTDGGHYSTSISVRIQCILRTSQAMEKTIFEVKAGSFIFTRANALALDICAEMIERFEKYDDEQYPGRIGQTIDHDASVKRSTDLVLSGKPHWQDLDRELFRSLNLVLAEFKQSYPFFAGPFKDMGYAIQRTAPGEFYHWHIDGGSHEFAQRQLVAIWYLNTLNDQGGETEFQHQAVKITPEAGKLVLFPPFWTHLHRGNTLQSGVKYIATTWVGFA